MDEKQIIQAYDTASLAAEALFEAGEKAIDAKSILDAAKSEATFNGSITGKNDGERDACAKTLLKPLFEQLSERQQQERVARYNFDQAERNVEKVRALLRLMEITARK